MITPHKYLDLDLSVINLGAIILQILKQHDVIKYDDLLSEVVSRRGQNAKEVFIPTLSLLYVLGKVEYHKDIDSIEYLNEA